MTTSTTALLVKRLRDAADELASAARFGLTIPTVASVNGYDNMAGLALSLDTVEDFDDWADYASDVRVNEYVHEDRHWQAATGTLGFEGLRVTFAVSTPLPSEPTTYDAAVAETDEALAAYRAAVSG